MSCLFSCCASLACGCCTSVASGITNKSARIAYCGLFGASLVVSWILREVASPLLEKFPCMSQFLLLYYFYFHSSHHFAAQFYFSLPYFINHAQPAEYFYDWLIFFALEFPLLIYVVGCPILLNWPYIFFVILCL